MTRAEPSTVQVRLNVPLDQLCRDLMRQRDEYAIANSLLWEVVEAARQLLCEPQGNETHYARCERVRDALKRLEAL